MTNPNLLFNYYPSYMVLKIFVNDNALRLQYINAVNLHNMKILDDPKYIDAGFDIYVPSNTICRERSVENRINKIDHKIRCSATIVSAHGEHNTGYYMHPRSSIYKTPLRLANSTGIIDSGYRGNLIGMFDCLEPYHEVEQHDRLLQICAPSLMPIFVEIVDTEMDLGVETLRGGGGFGSTGR
jgi:dUTPase